MKQEKINLYLEKHNGGSLIKFDEDNIYIAICYTLLANFNQAQIYFEKYCLRMIKPPKIWKMSNQPNWLVDIFILSGRKDLNPIIGNELEEFKKKKYGGDSPIAHASYGIMELLYPQKNDMPLHIQILNKYPEIKYTLSIGQAFQAIIDRNEGGLNVALKSLLLAHKGMAKHGGLRETPEGWLCLPAMSLAYVASKYQMQINIEDVYLSLGYIDYMKSNEEKIEGLNQH